MKNMEKLLFITTNKHKFEEIRNVLNKFGIEIEQLIMEYEEDKESDMADVCKKASRNLVEILNKPLFVEDTGLFFSSYNNFPGPLPKFVFNGIGFNGIFRLLDNKDRSAYFKTVIGYCEPGREPVLFEDVMKGKITKKIILPEKEAMPYDHIFIPEGYDKAIVEMDMETKNSFSQRGKVARKLGEFLKNKE
jgi:XTP/dITP diphosphohydrolase